MVKGWIEPKPYRCRWTSRVHRITVHRWFKQYRAGGLQEMLKIRQATGRTRVIPSAVIAGISQKSSEKSCNFNSYKYSGKWVEKKSQLLVKYQTLDKQLLSHSSQIKSTKMFDKEKRWVGIYRNKKTKKIAQSSLLVRVYYPKASKESDQILVSRWNSNWLKNDWKEKKYRFWS